MITPIRGRKRGRKPGQITHAQCLEMITPIRGRKLEMELDSSGYYEFRNDNPDKGTETFILLNMLLFIYPSV